MLHFLGIGAQKSGTTWIHHHLKKHPQIFFPEHKEIHFWDNHYTNGIEWYKSLFPNHDRWLDKILFKRNKQIKNGEITPAYAFLPLETIQEIHQNFPNTRLFYILRNPLDRAWSSANMDLRHADLKSEETPDQWFINHFNSPGSLNRGDYESSINRWLSIYKEKQLLILDYRTITSDPKSLLKALCNHINIDPNFYNNTPESEFKETIYGGSGIPIRQNLRPVLEELYKDKIDFYEELLGK